MEERYKVNYDHPNSMDHALLYQHLCELKAGNAIELPQYDYVAHTRKSRNHSPFLNQKVIIIIEGILLLTDKRLREEMDFFYLCRYAIRYPV